MPENLVIVESPAKAKTIHKYLGKDFEVLASYGHVRDLLPKNGAVDPDNNFAMQYIPIERNEKHVAKIIKALSKAKNLYLAPDPDREGEAIAWHLVELLKERKALKDKKIFRVSFHQITKNAIGEAIENPREISMDLVDAQQARRALDFLVGFNLSPLLWRKIQRGLSAGRVQSPALRLIVEREEEIEKFKKQEYWSIHAKAENKKQLFEAKLIEYQGKKLQQFDIVTQKESDAAVKFLTKAANGKLIVSKITRKEKKRQPYAPFTTSTLQQEASKKLGFSAQKTMMLAQQLYEGVDLEEGSVGLITYMRTDSVTLAMEAIHEMRDYIQKEFGNKNLPENPRLYKTKSKNAQEAHEAIRPTSIFRHYHHVKKYLSPDQYKLYQLIWKRAIASQMSDALLNTVSIDLTAGKDNIFRVSGSTVVFSGFLSVYEETSEDKKEESAEIRLPDLKENDSVNVEEIYGAQHFTEPPPRYSEASLIKALEEYGI
ncbi:MAG: DNA topoisomerase I, partial [Gammaproteobacteria bacterium RIFOXYB2_FULL_38_6]